MRSYRVITLLGVISILTIAATSSIEPDSIDVDLSKRDPAAFYDFNVEMLAHLYQPIKLDVLVASEDFDRETGWLVSSYYITPDELRGVELSVPRSAITDENKETLRVQGVFKLSGILERRQGQLSLRLLPAK